jgi:hypothetical protein
MIAALEHFVPRDLGAFGVTIRAQAAGRLWQDGEQRRLGASQLARRLAQVTPAGRRDALQGAAERRAIEVQAEDLVLGQMPFQLQGAPQLLELAGITARMRIEQSRHLHRQGAAAGDQPSATQVLPERAAQRQGIHPRMPIEPAILVGQQRLQVIGRDLSGADRIAPHPVAVGETPQRRAILGQHHPGQIVLRQGQREQVIGRKQYKRQSQRHSQPWSAQYRP